MSPTIRVIYMTADGAAEWAARGVPNSALLQKHFAGAQLTSALATLLNAQSSTPG